MVAAHVGNKVQSLKQGNVKSVSWGRPHFIAVEDDDSLIGGQVGGG